MLLIYVSRIDDNEKWIFFAILIILKLVVHYVHEIPLFLYGRAAGTTHGLFHKITQK
jgi:hypothetical protein